MTDRQYRQGHILLMQVAEIPERAQPVLPVRPGHVVIATGESGREHFFKGERVSLFQSDGVLYFAVSGDDESPPVILEHPEHGDIELPAGLYRVVEQREDDPIAHASRPSYD